MLIVFTFAGECTFEYFLGSPSSTCGWAQDGSDDFDWTRARGSTASYQTGPSFDHTYGTSKGKRNSTTLRYEGGRRILPWFMSGFEIIIFPTQTPCSFVYGSKSFEFLFILELR